MLYVLYSLGSGWLLYWTRKDPELTLTLKRLKFSFCDTNQNCTAKSRWEFRFFPFSIAQEHYLSDMHQHTLRWPCSWIPKFPRKTEMRYICPTKTLPAFLSFIPVWRPFIWNNFVSARPIIFPLWGTADVRLLLAYRMTSVVFMSGKSLCACGYL